MKTSVSPRNLKYYQLRGKIAIARGALDEMRGKVIVDTDGKPISADGTLVIYFGGTQAQRDDHDLYMVRPGAYDSRVSANGSANNVVPKQEGILRDQRDAIRLEHLSATNGATTLGHTIEGLLLGGGAQAGRAVVQVKGKSIAGKAELAVVNAAATKGGAELANIEAPNIAVPV